MVNKVLTMPRQPSNASAAPPAASAAENQAQHIIQPVSDRSGNRSSRKGSRSGTRGSIGPVGASSGGHSQEGDSHVSLMDPVAGVDTGISGIGLPKLKKGRPTKAVATPNTTRGSSRQS